MSFKISTKIEILGLLISTLLFVYDLRGDNIGPALLSGTAVVIFGVLTIMNVINWISGKTSKS